MRALSGSRLKCLIAVGIVVIACGVILIIYSWMYPFGRRGSSHQYMAAALRFYAIEHEERFPYSVDGALVALSKLYPVYATAEALAGYSGKISEAQFFLQHGVPLTGTACSWHYVQGLDLNSNPNIALLWETQFGIIAFGQRDSHRRRVVVFVSGMHEYIQETE